MSRKAVYMLGSNEIHEDALLPKFILWLLLLLD